MSRISFAGAFTSTALTVPDVYLNVLQPKGSVVKPASVGVLAIRGVASWGPVDVATSAGALGQLAKFGAQTVRKYDLVTAAALALQIQSAIGAGAGLMLSRAADGTDTAAAGTFGLTASTATVGMGGSGYTAGSVTLPNGVVGTTTVGTGAITAFAITTGAATSQPSNPVAVPGGTGGTVNLTYTKQLSLTSKYTGSAGNTAKAEIGDGSAAGSKKITLSMPGFAPEVFDNISGSGNAFWLAMADAINNGNSPQRGPSQLMIATAGTAASTATNDSVTLAGGTDGVAGIDSADLVGQEADLPRTGVYTFRGTGCSHGHIADFDDHTQNATLAVFAQSEGIYWGVNGTAGQAVADAVSEKADDGLDTPWIKPYLGDWDFVTDNVNNTQRLLGPATLGMAELSCLQPQQSGLNKQVPLVVATQTSKSSNGYSNEDLAALVSAGIEVITNPIPRGAMFGHRIGRNASSDPARNTDNWPVLTSFIARSLAGPSALGPAIGQVITDDFFTTWYAVLDNYLGTLKSATPEPLIQDYQIQFDRSNNPEEQTATGLVVAEVLIEYLGIAQVFLVNLQAGSTVVIPQAASSFAGAA